MSTSDRTTARIVGWLFIGTFVFSIPGYLLYGPLCAGIGTGLLLGYLMYSSGLLPRRLGLFAMTAGSFAFVAATGVLFGAYEPQSAPHFLLTFPEMVWELTFGVWLIAKGFSGPAQRRAATAGAAAAPQAVTA